MDDLWRDADAGEGDLAQLVYLSNLIGRDTLLVQPGGGNTSVKRREPDLFGVETEALVVKGSGTDLRTITPAGFTHLSLERLALMRGRRSVDDDEMLRLMRAAMLFADRDPLPSVETPLHSLLPYRFIAHTHDVATLSLSDTPGAEEHVRRAFAEEVAFLPYARPGFPLAKRMAERYAERPPERAKALVLEKHGLVAWGDSARECYRNLTDVISRAEAYVAERASGKRVFGAPAPAPDAASRRDLAAAVLPAVRGELLRAGWPAVLHLDDSPEVLDATGGASFGEVAARGVMTPEHILRAGVRPLVVDIAGASPRDAQERVRDAMRAYRERYASYAAAHGQPQPIADYLKTVVVPGLGVICAGKDRRSALVASECYTATIRAMAGAEAVESFAFISEADQCEMEYWPLERRKIEEAASTRKDLDGKVAFVIGAASGIGRATAARFLELGAHAVLADIDLAGAQSLADELNASGPERALALRCDVTDAGEVAEAFRRAVLHFGGLDVLFYSPGVGPAYHPVAEMPDDEIEQKLRVHFQGAVAATREAAHIMIDQGTGGRLIYNASKAAYAPGDGFAAYGASKAALVHYVRNVASELGKHGITANYINADAVDTPLFRNLVRLRAEQQGKTEEEMLAAYEQRSTLRAATIPPEAVADAVCFLASDRAAYTTGCVITVGGGAEGFPR